MSQVGLLHAGQPGINGSRELFFFDLERNLPRGANRANLDPGLRPSKIVSLLEEGLSFSEEKNRTLTFD